jgi:HK97 family phage prohead protease
MEKRILTLETEVRTAGENEPSEIIGRGAVVGVTTDLGYIEEEIAPDAFREADLSDVLVAFNHDLNIILGRTTAATAEIDIDSEGNLNYRATKIDYENPSVKSAARYIERGEVSKSSFMFTIDDYTWEDSEKYGKRMKRLITRVGKVYEAGPVTIPAYEDTSANSRSQILESRSKWIEANEPDNGEEFRAEYTKKFYETIIK